MTRAIPQDNLVLPTGRISQAWQRFLTALSGLVGDVVVYTPTVYAGTGTLTATAQARYQKIGNQVFLDGSVTVTNNGTAAQFVAVSLPTAIALPTSQTVGSCAQNNGTAMVARLGDQIGGSPFNPSFRCVAITNTSGGYPGVLTTMQFRIAYEVN